MRLRVILFKCLVASVRGAVEKAALNCVGVHDNTVLLVISREAAHGEHEVLAIAHVSARNIVVIMCANNRRLGVAENVDLVIKPIVEIGCIDGDALLALRATELVTRRLVVVCIRNHAGHEAKNRGRVDLQMARIGVDVLGETGHIRLVRFIGVHVFNNTRMRRQFISIRLQAGRLLLLERVEEVS